MKNRNKKTRYTIYILIFSFLIFFAQTAVFRFDEKTNDKIITYLSSKGLKTENKPFEISPLKIPEEFDSVFKSYNSIQTESGSDLSEYKGKIVIKYSYKLSKDNPNEESSFTVNVFIFKGEIIAADISKSGKDGFIRAVK